MYWICLFQFFDSNLDLFRTCDICIFFYFIIETFALTTLKIELQNIYNLYISLKICFIRIDM
jgi:hypothetical protein